MTPAGEKLMHRRAGRRPARSVTGRLLQAAAGPLGGRRRWVAAAGPLGGRRRWVAAAGVAAAVVRQ
jgi:hypothetical protein